jgi:PHP family Zn ribbon phosphoesterase
VYHVGTKSKQIHALYEKYIKLFGSELNILQNVPIEQISKTDFALAEALSKMRSHSLQKICGFDGKYGKITII